MIPDLDVAVLSRERLLELLGEVEITRVRLLARLLEPPPAPTSDHALSQQEAARLRPALGLKFIRELTRTGRVPSVPRGRRRLVRLSDLDAYLAARCAPGLPPERQPAVFRRHARRIRSV